MSRIFLHSLCAISAACLGAACQPEPAFENDRNTVVAGKANIGGPFTLTDHTGQTVTDRDYLGKPTLIYFGFAFCPDVCPTALQQMGAALEILGQDADRLTPIFITVDPGRDTPDRLAVYVTSNGFPENLIGLTGTNEQVGEAAAAYAVYAARINDTASTAGFTFDHTSIIYLMDKNGDFVDAFSHLDTPERIASVLKAHLRF